MRVKVLKLRDFQAHRELDIKLSPTITSIQGPTDIGKSAIIRALRWLCLNDFPGDDFINWDGKQALVKIVCDTGQEIGRGKSKVANVYTLDDQDFKSFRDGVPEPVAKLLAISPINFQNQHDSPFWFSETAGEVSRQLNAIIDLSVIDTSLANISSLVRRDQERQAVTAERVKSKTTELEGLKHEKKRVAEFAELTEARSKFTKAEESYNQLYDALVAINNIDLSSLVQKSEEAARLFVLLRRATVLKKRVVVLSEIITLSTTNERAAQDPPDLRHVQTAYQHWTQLKSVRERLTRLTSLAEAAATRLDIRSETLRVAEKRFHRASSGERCAACGQIIPA